VSVGGGSGRLFRGIIALSLSEFQRVGVIWRAELADDLPLVRCDRVQLQQVILNLFRNALDSMSSADGRLCGRPWHSALRQHWQADAGDRCGNDPIE
jgi:nitrogen-specific signal transduction histidine kinase